MQVNDSLSFCFDFRANQFRKLTWSWLYERNSSCISTRLKTLRALFENNHRTFLTLRNYLRLTDIMNEDSAMENSVENFLLSSGQPDAAVVENGSAPACVPVCATISILDRRGHYCYSTCTNRCLIVFSNGHRCSQSHDLGRFHHDLRSTCHGAISSITNHKHEHHHRLGTSHKVHLLP